MTRSCEAAEIGLCTIGGGATLSLAGCKVSMTFGLRMVLASTVGARVCFASLTKQSL